MGLRIYQRVVVLQAGADLVLGEGGPDRELGHAAGLLRPHREVVGVEGELLLKLAHYRLVFEEQYGAGTVLFFEDQTVVRQLQEQFALYADNFPVWSEQASGMAQFAVWTALAEHKVGASLQHYNPLVDAQTHKTWNLPESWKLRAQMPFGAIAAPAGFKVFGN
ncbi:hypothetical protein PAERUG_P48_London_17_VIM_2_01_13_02863 [Pseudomonas aeruginosa]|nr:hypothetical protein PAERUG_P48_London_17_VIM_2_01_13_02863 [Pseudomonas aeruginosa]